MKADMFSWFKSKQEDNEVVEEIKVLKEKEKYQPGETYILEHVNKAGDKTYEAVVCYLYATNSEDSLTRLNTRGHTKPVAFPYHNGYYVQLLQWSKHKVYTVSDAKDAITAYNLACLKEHSHTNVIKYP